MSCCANLPVPARNQVQWTGGVGACNVSGLEDTKAGMETDLGRLIDALSPTWFDDRAVMESAT